MTSRTRKEAETIARRMYDSDKAAELAEDSDGEWYTHPDLETGALWFGVKAGEASVTVPFGFDLEDPDGDPDGWVNFDGTEIVIS